MTIPARVAHLIEHFHDNRADLRSSHYNETQVRREFIDPFFKALGWDVDNEGSAPEAYKDVIHEDAVKIGGVTKAPDYSFRVGGERKFFVEAKKPAVNLKTDTSPAFQLRRYAWSANLPLSILTDFEEFIVYDCRVRPDQTDRADTARILYVTYDQYADRWDSIAGLFARDAVLHGALDQYVDTLKAHKGVATVDAAFLKEIEGWRDTLARDIAARNPGLSQRDLNFAVQMTIDRIIFLRMAEDRGIEPYGDLNALRNGAHVYERLTRMFRQADDRYNSGLFHFQREKGRDAPDDLTLDLRIGDEPLKAIFKSLYYPDSPYEFSVLPIEILGHVYEQFLGKVITLTPDHQAVVEEKPEVRKAGGVYYTPTYIVDYIVAHTIGKLLEGKTPRQVAGGAKAAPLRVVDPACGSGSFLIGAYGYLLDWYRRRYVEAGPERHKKELYQGADGEWRLTTAERKRILLDHIYGVDIDAQAVEVTKLSLLLKVLEGENRQVLARQLQMFQERALPDLARNIQCGNSLIGPDFYDGQLGLLDDETRYRINVFDWRAAFPAVFQGENPGFDAVIGNPPYIRIQNLSSFNPRQSVFFKKTYASAASGNYDIYVVFVERGLELLNRTGRLGFILPSKFLSTDYGATLRSLLANASVVDALIDFGHNQVFGNATTYTCLLFLDRTQPSKIYYSRTEPAQLGDKEREPSFIPSAQLTDKAWLFAGDKIEAILRKLKERGAALLELPTDMARGSSTGADDVFCLVQSEESLATRDGQSVEIEHDILRRPLYATDFTRYHFRPRNNERIIFPYVVSERGYQLLNENEFATKWPQAYQYLKTRRDRLEARKQYQQWYGFSAPRNLNVHDNAFMLVPLLADRGLFAPMPDDRSSYCMMASGGFSVGLDQDKVHLHPFYILGIANSRLLFWNLRLISNRFRGGWITCTKQYFGTLPIRTIDFANAADRARHDRMVALVEEMLRLHKRLAAAHTPHEKTALQHQIDALDRQIDALVYELYGLTDDEIRIVAGDGRG